MPSPPNSSAIADALLAVLNGDPALMRLMPDGAFYAVAPASLKRFVIVSLIVAIDESVFGQRAIENSLYLVEARARSDVGGDVDGAALQIEALIGHGGLTIPGFALMTCHREEFVRTIEDDQYDTSIRWLRTGGQYRVQVSIPTA